MRSDERMTADAFGRTDENDSKNDSDVFLVQPSVWLRSSSTYLSKTIDAIDETRGV